MPIHYNSAPPPAQIPGLTFGIAGVASAAAWCDVDIVGSSSSSVGNVAISLALDACASVLGIEVCGSDLSPQLPVTLLAGTYDFSGICRNDTAAAAARLRYSLPRRVDILV